MPRGEASRWCEAFHHFLTSGLPHPFPALLPSPPSTALQRRSAAVAAGGAGGRRGARKWHADHRPCGIPQRRQVLHDQRHLPRETRVCVSDAGKNKVRAASCRLLSARKAKQDPTDVETRAICNAGAPSCCCLGTFKQFCCPRWNCAIAPASCFPTLQIQRQSWCATAFCLWTSSATSSVRRRRVALFLCFCSPRLRSTPPSCFLTLFPFPCTTCQRRQRTSHTEFQETFWTGFMASGSFALQRRT